ncbi:energy-coupling factor transporter transmembrane component T [Maledivibacter halophilus]|uniref:Energy-coupling factor transport system permease protein n=1 Tax=Maledivibacter halophilus TaxID=36842 RepID=A0A1T5L927_9FIRM|nr:energy-coupling factor transporter transmembrane component T [Maledivibacter halophilus]SKC72481.1 energy-coupling factor transport system permease protein [Maledivibacter halophilus]
MSLSMVYEERKREGFINLDPRTKLFILLAGNIGVLIAPSLIYELFLAAIIVAFGIFHGQYKYSIKISGIYLFLVAVQILGPLFLDGILRLIIVTFAVFVRKIFPCAMLGGIIILTTRVNEFMAAMNKLHMPKKIVIPLAVTLRYFPMAGEEWNHIKDAMNIRGISSSFLGFLVHPIMTIEYIYVPMMISASKIADELSAAAITRGIDNPRPRTCMQRISFGFADLLWALIFLTLLIAGFFI